MTPAEKIDAARHVRRALVGCAVVGWLGFLLHVIMQAILEGA